jgi:hypothetical protein
MTIVLIVLAVAAYAVAVVGTWALCCAASRADDDSARVAREEGWK